MNTTKRTVSHEDWVRARKAFLEREKAFTRERDALSAARRDLPREKIEKSYLFEEPEGKRTLADLFAGKRQLIVYHFMFDPSWEAGCKGCSYVSDHLDGATAHLRARDTSLAVISRAPLAKLLPFKERMGWKFRWLSSAESDFNYDFDASFREGETGSYNYERKPFAMADLPGLSVFLRDGGEIFHTYSTYARGLDLLLGAYNLLDLTPLGRQEAGLPQSMAWVRHHDRYENA
jgi:predicted dithiol-disulfide oxidoreductase (DUF899 family)